MSANTTIEWTDRTWNPVRGCSRVSEGCRNCYAERMAGRFAKPGEPFHGFIRREGIGTTGSAVSMNYGPREPQWTGRVELVLDKLAEPLRWRKPARVFVNSMSDLFHESLSDSDIDRVFAVMALAPHLTFQVLTKRAERMRAYFADIELCAIKIGETEEARRADQRVRNEDLPNDTDAYYGQTLRFEQGVGALDNMERGKPLPNLWLGVSVENQETADERIPRLLATPAAVRFLSCEPLLGPVDLSRYILPPGAFPVQIRRDSQERLEYRRFVDWVIIGGESGPGARPCDVAWIRSIVAQCKAASVPVFVKQLGAHPFDKNDQNPFMWLRDRKGGEPNEWPEDLRIRELPR